MALTPPRERRAQPVGQRARAPTPWALWPPSSRRTHVSKAAAGYLSSQGGRRFAARQHVRRRGDRGQEEARLR
eukprot:3276910-Pyramimonas_sp.AAC.1